MVQANRCLVCLPFWQIIEPTKQHGFWEFKARNAWFVQRRDLIDIQFEDEYHKLENNGRTKELLSRKCTTNGEFNKRL